MAAQFFRGAVDTPTNLIAGDNIFATEYFASANEDPSKLIAGGLFRVEKGKPLTSTYTFDESKLMIEGELRIETSTGQDFVAKKGDIIYFPSGCTATFSSDSSGLAFYCAQRAGQASVTPTES